MNMNDGINMSGRIMCGWAMADITPPGNMPLLGQFFERIADHARDPLQATVMAMESECGDCVLWISVDLLVIEKDLVDRLQKDLKTQIPGLCIDKLVVNATHIHTGPYTSKTAACDSLGWGPLHMLVTPEGCLTPEKYMEETFMPNVERACVDAWNKRSESSLSFRLGHATLGHNRRVTYSDGSARVYGATDIEDFYGLEGPSDSGVELMYVFGSAGDLEGVVANIACPAQVLECADYYTADIWGDLRQMLCRQFGRPIYVLAQCAAAGDQAPRDMIRKNRGEPDMSGPEGCAELARRLFLEVMNNYEQAKQTRQCRAVFIHNIIPLTMPIRTVSMQEYEQAQIELASIMEKYKDASEISQEDRMNATIPQGVISRFQTQKESAYYHYSLHVIRIGEAVFVTNPFELFIAYGLRIKARSKASQTFTVQLCNDCAGYLPTSEAIQGGSYSTMITNGILGPDGGNGLVNATVEAIHRMFEGTIE